MKAGDNIFIVWALGVIVGIILMSSTATYKEKIESEKEFTVLNVKYKCSKTIHRRE